MGLEGTFLTFNQGTEMKLYKIVRIYEKDFSRRTIRKGLSLEQARAHCKALGNLDIQRFIDVYVHQIISNAE